MPDEAFLFNPPSGAQRVEMTEMLPDAEAEAEEEEVKKVEWVEWVEKPPAQGAVEPRI